MVQKKSLPIKVDSFDERTPAVTAGMPKPAMDSTSVYVFPV